MGRLQYMEKIKVQLNEILVNDDLDLENRCIILNLKIVMIGLH